MADLNEIVEYAKQIYLTMPDIKPAGALKLAKDFYAEAERQFPTVQSNYDPAGRMCAIQHENNPHMDKFLNGLL